MGKEQLLAKLLMDFENVAAGYEAGRASAAELGKMSLADLAVRKFRGVPAEYERWLKVHSSCSGTMTWLELLELNGEGYWPARRELGDTSPVAPGFKYDPQITAGGSTAWVRVDKR